MISTDKYKLLVKEHLKKLEQLKKIITFYEQKRYVLASFNNLSIAEDENVNK